MRIDGLDRFLREREFSGVVLIRRGNEPVFAEAYGLASPRWGVPNHLELRFDVASVSKLFTSVAVLQQVGHGALDLDAPLDRSVDLRGTSLRTDVTLRQLLLHTSGIADIADEERGEDYADVFRQHPCHVVTTTRDFLPLFAGKPANFPPGTTRRYCNAGYVLAGLAVEEVTGRPFREYVEAEILGPAGMTRSAYLDKRYAHPDLAEGYDPGDHGRLEQNIYAYPPIGAPDGGAHCTAGDLLRFLDALRADILLPGELRELFFTPQVPIDDETSQGFGLQFTEDCWWKEGRSEGASAILQHHHRPGTDSVVLANSMEGAWPVVDELDRLAAG